jgi:hypothetical protein
MSDAPRLGRDVFLALAAVGWADGNLDPDEADAIVRTAVEAGLELEAIEEIERATKSPIDMGIIDRAALSKEDRLFVYAVASWMTRLDGEVSEAEEAALARLGDLMKVPERPRHHADAIAREIAEQPEGDRPDRFDLMKLRSIITERLRIAQQKRAEGGTPEELLAGFPAGPAEQRHRAADPIPCDPGGRALHQRGLVLRGQPRRHVQRRPGNVHVTEAHDRVPLVTSRIERLHRGRQVEADLGQDRRDHGRDRRRAETPRHRLVETGRAFQTGHGHRQHRQRSAHVIHEHESSHRPV